MATPAAAALFCAGGAVLAVAVPALASRRWGGLRSAGILAGSALGALFVAGTLLMADPARAFAATLPLAGFAVASAGGARLLLAAGAPRAAAAGLAALLGCALLVLPFLADPLVEPGGPGKSSPGAVAGILGASPLAASVGGGLGVDLLRAPLAYGGPSGPGLSRIGAYHPSPYPDPARSGLRFAVAGILLFTFCGVASVRRPA